MNPRTARDDPNLSKRPPALAEKVGEARGFRTATTFPNCLYRKQADEGDGGFRLMGDGTGGPTPRCSW